MTWVTTREQVHRFIAKGGETLICTLGSESEKATRWRSLSPDKMQYLTHGQLVQARGEGWPLGCVTQYVQDLNHLFRTGSARGEAASQRTGRPERKRHDFMGTGRRRCLLRWPMVPPLVDRHILLYTSSPVPVRKTVQTRQQRRPRHGMAKQMQGHTN